MMQILSWNCRGLGSPEAVNALRRIVINENPQIVFLQETKLHQHELERAAKKLKFSNCLVVGCEGQGRKRRGGLALMWKSEWCISITSFSQNHIDATIHLPDFSWRFTGIYGYPEESNKRKTGELLRMLYTDETEPWLCGGDLNLMLWSTEKQGGGDFNFEDAAILRQAMDFCNLEDLGFIGHPFTWTNNRGGHENLQERLDRFVANRGWKEKYGGSSVCHLEKRKSDHLPLLVSIKERVGHVEKKRRKKLYRFEEMWLRDGKCMEIIQSSWTRGEEISHNIARTAAKLSTWSKHTFGNFAKDMRELQSQMKQLMKETQTHEIIAKMKAIDERMDEMEAREELFWRQRSRQDWLKNGDKNTKFFHTKARQRVERNTITVVLDGAGNRYEDEEQIAEIFVTHFESLFTSCQQVDVRPIIDKVQPKVSSEMCEMLRAPYVGEEVYEALMQMHPTKAPGPDGMCALFYQKMWSIVGEDVIKKVLDILNNGGDIGAINQTYLALIPKKKQCETPVDYRPISLCNVIYKLVSKVLANRLKKVLPNIIHESQSGFVPGRLITDNILVAYECFHYLRKKRTGRAGYMGLKLDMSKAYDRVEWCFLEAMMEKMGFPSDFISATMRCVSSASFSILLNGQPSRRFLPSRGLRQGDPLSPFLFILCAEGLSVLLRDAELKKEIHGIKIGKKVEPISHLFFADDSLLFIRANDEEVEKVLDIFSIYEAASGQKLNMEKSEVSFSRNIEPQKKELLQMKLSFKAVDEHDKYLGLPTYVGSSKKQVFKSIQERIMKKLKGWKEGFLSQAGREVLIKAVAQAIPMYSMQCFTIPVSILHEMERLCRNFYWGQRGSERKTAWIAWEKLYASKKEGGLGMRNMQMFNKALLAKQGWRVMTNPDSLMAKTLKNKYFPNASFMEAKLSSTASYTWRSILSARDIIARGAIKVVGEGRSIDVWKDPWIPKLPNFKLITSRSNQEDLPQMVSDLIENGRWNVALLNNIFTRWERDEIKSIPLSMYPEADSWAWALTKEGTFSVKSAYFTQLTMNRAGLSSSSGSKDLAAWARVWKAKAAPKIQTFGWKVLHDSIPVRVNLMKRKLCDDGLCPMCGEENETVMHALVKCEGSAMIWRVSPLRIDSRLVTETNFMEWCLNMEKQVKEPLWWSLFWNLLWGIWLRRNAWLFNQLKIHYMKVIEKAVAFVGEWEKAHEIAAPQHNDTSRLVKIWKPPDQGRLKINTDAAIFGDQLVGFGGIVRDQAGEVMLATCETMDGDFMVDEAEAMAARHALQITIEAGFRQVILETDNLKLYTHLKKGYCENTSFGRIVADILKMVGTCNSVSFAHVCRGGNRVAHILAKLSKNFREMMVWMEEVPNEALTAVISDAMI